MACSPEVNSPGICTTASRTGDDKIISMYARGMTTREIQGHLEEMYGIEVSPALISNVTDAVVEEVKLWQGRQLEELYPILYLDALMVKAVYSKELTHL
jgi:putative transposase